MMPRWSPCWGTSELIIQNAVVDAMCKGPATVTERYGIAAIPLGWYQNYEQRASGVTAMALKALGKGVDVFRTARWVSRHDMVIVPGMGVLEATLPLWPWEMPYAMVLLSASGRLFGTKVALPCVGASVIKQRLTRRLFDSAARLAFYRSYRDTGSRDAMRQRGLDVTRDRVYADLAFGIPVPPYDPGDPQMVAVGVMDYRGSNDDKGQAAELHTSYVETMKLFVRWLVDSGRRVRFLVGDTNNSDQNVVPEILTDLRAHRPDLDPARVVAEPISTYAELMDAIAPAGIVVATRFHNMVCALMLCKPTISLGYAPKFTVLMADMGLAEFCQTTKTLDLERLIEQFKDLDKRQAELRQSIMECNMVKAQLVHDQFAELSDVLFSRHGMALASAKH